ncbi:hypothetical protein KKF86_06125, partial [bacterium]|nr:hypothetical protein [bacterium]
MTISYIILVAIFAQSANDILVPQGWPSDKPYWDMPINSADSLDIQASRSLKKTLEYQLNPFHQPNELYGKETCHG